MDSQISPRTRQDLMPQLRKGGLPDGPVRLWIAVYTNDGALMGAEPFPRGSLAWIWRDGSLHLAHGEITVIIRRGGWYSCGVIVAVSEAEQAAPFCPVWKIGLGESQELRPGDTMHILDGTIRIRPEGITAV